MNRRTRHTAVLALVLILSTLVWCVGTVCAQTTDTPTKVEAVFAKLALDGRVKTVYVVNHFDVTKATTFNDYGAYANVNRLTDNGTLETTSDGVSITATPGRFFYQGELKSTSLPWTVAFSATLNGHAVDLKDLAGATGALVLTLAIKGDSSTFARHDALSAVVTLPFDRASNVTAQGGVLAVDGKATTVTFTALPGTSPTFVVHADVRNFAMPGLRIAALPMAFDTSTLDAQAITLKDSDGEPLDLSKMTDGIASLADGGAALNAKRGELLDGLKALAGGMATLGDHASSLASGASRLKQGADALSSGVARYQSGVGKAANGALALSQGATALAEGLTTLAANGESLTTGAIAVRDGLTAVRDQVAAKTPPATAVDDAARLAAASKAFRGGLEQAARGMSALHAGADQLVAQGDRLVASLAGIPATPPDAKTAAEFASQFGLTPDKAAADPERAMLNTLAEQSSALHRSVSEQIALKQAVTAYVAGVKTLAASAKPLDEALTTLTTQYAKIDAGVQAMATSIAAMGDSVAQAQQLKSALDRLVQGQTDVVEGLSSYVNGVKASAAGVNGDQGLKAGAATLASGLSTLSTQGQALVNGATDLSSGARALASGATRFQNGAAQAAQGGTAFQQGLMTYLDGVNTLAIGLTTFQTKSAKMTASLTQGIDNAIETLFGGQAEPTSFVSPKNHVRTTQFVLISDAIGTP